VKRHGNEEALRQRHIGKQGSGIDPLGAIEQKDHRLRKDGKQHHGRPDDRAVRRDYALVVGAQILFLLAQARESRVVDRADGAGDEVV